MATDEVMQRLVTARELQAAGKNDAAWKVVNTVLTDEPNSVDALILGASLHEKARLFPIAYQMARRCIDLAPWASEVWTNYGRISEQLYQLEDAEAAYRKAVMLSRKPTSLALNLNNLSAFYNITGEWEKAEETAKQCLALAPDSRKGRGNLGLCQLARHQWVPGWENYGAILGSEYRKYIKIHDEPDWKAEPGKVVLIYGEQGIGDEVSFASMIPDAIAQAERVILDCDRRLEGLYRRSFPTAKVYGARGQDQAVVDAEDAKPDYSISIGQLGALFRLKDSDFPGVPYLVPDPERMQMWKSYLADKRKPVIGIAWSGGLQHTGAKYRRWTLEQ